MADIFRHIVVREHLRFQPEALLVFLIIHARIARRNDQDTRIAQQKRERLCDLLSLHADRLRRELHGRARHVKFQNALLHSKLRKIRPYLFN